MAGIIDSHIHMYPPEVHADPAAWARIHGEPGWASYVAPVGKRSIQGWADLPRLIADMDRAGIEACVMLGWYWERQETCELQNGWYAEWVRSHPGRLIGFASVQPSAGQPAIDALERALDSGLRGIGEILPQAQRFTFEDPWWHRVVGIAIERGIPITLHVTDPNSGKAAGPVTPLEDYIRLAGEFPEATFIFAHWGGGLPIYELNGAVRSRLANVFYDTAASPLVYDTSVFRSTADLVGAKRILYGSDYPLLLHPRESREPGFERFLADVASAGLTDPEREAVLGGNMRRILEKRRASP